MKKLFVLIALIAVAAACGGGGGSAAPSRSNEGSKQSVAGPVTAPDPSRSTGDGSTSTLPGTTVPALQGPPVIRQAQMSITVGNGLFDSKLLEVRTIVQAQGGYIAGTDAQAKPLSDEDPGQIRT